MAHVKRMPCIEQGHTEGGAVQTVGHHAIQLNTLVITPAHHHHIVIASTEKIAKGALLGHLLHALRLPAMTVEEFDAVSFVPVSGYHHLAAVSLKSYGQCPFSVHTAEAVEAMLNGMVAFHREGLPDAQRFVVSATYQHQPGLHDQRKAIVVDTVGIHQMPTAVTKVFGRGRGHKTLRMTANHHYFVVNAKHRMTAASNVHGRHALCLNLDNRDKILLCDKRQAP